MDTSSLIDLTEETSWKISQLKSLLYRNSLKALCVILVTNWPAPFLCLDEIFLLNILLLKTIQKVLLISCHNYLHIISLYCFPIFVYIDIFHPCSSPCQPLNPQGNSGWNPQRSGNLTMPAALWDSKLVHRNEGKCLALASFVEKMAGSDAIFSAP